MDDLYKDSRCRRCGECCKMSDGSLCQHLTFQNGISKCCVYDNRPTVAFSTTGKWAYCVSIQKEIEDGNGGPDCCAYVQEIKRREC